MSTQQPGWYPDPEDPNERLRFWDGTQWTAQEREHPDAATKSRSWFFRHKVLTGVIAVLLLFVITGIAAGGEEEPTTANNNTARDDSNSSEGTDSDADPGPNSEGPEGPDDAEANEQEGSSSGGNNQQRKRAARMYLVTRVVDGDTLELGNGSSVRLVGIDTPERGQCGYEAASANLARLVLGKRVRLTESDEDTDRYGRLLRYVNIATMDAGLTQITQGLAIARYDSRDGYGFHQREPIYIRADKGAKNFKCPRPEPAPPPPASNCAPGYIPCVPPYPPDVDCPDVNGPIAVTGPDPHGLDADGDGTACE